MVEKIKYKEDAPTIEVYTRGIEIANRVKALHLQGYSDQDMYIITDDDNDLSILKGLTDIEIQEDDFSVWDRFKNFFKGEQTIGDAFRKLGMKQDEIRFYRKKLYKGRYLLFIDKDREFSILDDYFQPISEEQRKIKRKVIRSEEELPERIRQDIGLDNETHLGDEIERANEIRLGIDYNVKDRM